jgi:hypothetical protein
MHSKVWEYPFTEMWLKSLAKSLGKTSLNVMDFGCWLCPLPEHLARQGHTVWGVDDDDWGHIRQCDVSSHYPNVRYHIDDVRKLEITDFDAIISCSVLEHIEPTLRIELLRHLKSMLQPNGKQMHLVDFYFPEKKDRDDQRMNFYEVANEMEWHIPNLALCPGSPTFDFEQVRSRVNFIRKDHEARIAIGDDLPSSAMRDDQHWLSAIFRRWQKTPYF